MENICIIDTETTGLDSTKGKTLEVGAILYNIPTRSILCQASTLRYAEENAAFEINRIDVKTLKKVNPTIEQYALDLIKQMMMTADALVAHNAEFDKKWIALIPTLEQISRNKEWICTKNDVTWPVKKGCSLSLINICADLMVPIITAHRSLSDCTLLLRAIECNDDIEYFLDKSGKGRVTYYALVNYENRQIAKENGFQWDNIKKVWFARLHPEKAQRLPFTVYPVENIAP